MSASVGKEIEREPERDERKCGRERPSHDVPHRGKSDCAKCRNASHDDDGAEHDEGGADREDGERECASAPPSACFGNAMNLVECVGECGDATRASPEEYECAEGQHPGTSLVGELRNEPVEKCGCIRRREREDHRRYACECGIAPDEAGECEDDQQRGEDGEKKEVRHLRRFAHEVFVEEAVRDVASQWWQTLDQTRGGWMQGGEDVGLSGPDRPVSFAWSGPGSSVGRAAD